MATGKLPQKTNSVKSADKKTKIGVDVPKTKKSVLNQRKSSQTKKHNFSTKLDIKKTSFLTAFRKNLGNIGKSCEDIGIDRQTYYNWLAGNELFKKAIEEINESGIDFVESKLFELIDGAQYEAVSNNGKVVTLKQAPNTQSVLFFLKTKGKSRGYVEKLEIDHNINTMENITFIIKGKDK